MATQAVQLPSKTGSGFRKTRAWIKRQTNKLRRRDEKRHGEDAAPRHIGGYAD